MSKTQQPATFSFNWHWDDGEVDLVEFDDDLPPLSTFDDVINWLNIAQAEIVDQTNNTLTIKEGTDCQQGRVMIVTKL